MSTTAYDPLKWLYKTWDNDCGYKSAVGSGMVGDAAHQKRGGYHIGRQWNPSRNYSIIRPDDKGGPSDATTAIDVSMDQADMVLCTRHLRAVWLDKSDPRRKYINAFNGWMGYGDAIRFDFVTGTKERASSDHKWHIHLELRRKWCLSMVAHQAVASILRGQSKADYLKSIGGKATAPATPAAPVTGKTPAAKPAAKPPAKPAAPPYPGTPLKVGSKGAAVKTYQEQMIVRGYKSIGSADGTFGPKCQSVTVAFQRLCKVTADGVVGPATWPLPWTRPQ